MWEHILGLISRRAALQKTAALCLAENGKTCLACLRCRWLAVGLLLPLGKPLPFALAENSRARFAYLVYRVFVPVWFPSSIVYSQFLKHYNLSPKYTD